MKQIGLVKDNAATLYSRKNYSNVKSDKKRLYNLVQHRNADNCNTVCETLLGVFLRMQIDRYKITMMPMRIKEKP